VESSQQKTPRKVLGRQPWYKHVSKLRGQEGTMQVSPTPDATPLCSARGGQPSWASATAESSLRTTIPSPGFRISPEVEDAPPTPSWQRDWMLRLETGRLIDKCATPYMLNKVSRTFGGHPEIDVAMTPGIPAYLRAGWRKERADVRENLDQLRHTPDVEALAPSTKVFSASASSPKRAKGGYHHTPFYHSMPGTTCSTEWWSRHLDEEISKLDEFRRAGSRASSAQACRPKEFTDSKYVSVTQQTY